MEGSQLKICVGIESGNVELPEGVEVGFQISDISTGI